MRERTLCVGGGSNGCRGGGKGTNIITFKGKTRQSCSSFIQLNKRVTLGLRLLRNLRNEPLKSITATKKSLDKHIAEKASKGGHTCQLCYLIRIINM